MAVVLGLLAAPGGEAVALEPGLRFDQYAYMEWPSVARSAELRGLALARDGRLWIATSQGLIRFDGQRLETAGHGLPPGRIQALVEDAGGALWIGSSGGLARVPAGTRRATMVTAGLPSPNVRALLAGRDGSVWAGLQTGLARWDGKRWWPETGGLPGGIVVDALGQDPDGTLWVGSRDHGLWRRQQDQWRQVAPGGDQSDGQGPPGSSIRALLRDRAGHLWVATKAGLFARDEHAGAWRELALPRTACGDRIRAMAEDPEGGLWLATDRCGLHRLRDRRFRALSAADGLPSDNVLGLAAMPDGTTWAGTRGDGIMRWRDSPASATRVPCAAELPCASCWDFSRGRSGQANGVLMVCSPNTVLRWDGQRIGRVAALPGLTGASFAIEARDGSSWMTLGNKVVRQGADGAVSSLQEQEVLAGSRLLYEGRDGTIWIVAGDGVAVWRGGTLRIVRLPADERPVAPSNVWEDAAGTLWIGTKGEGLRRLRGDRITTIGVSSGLPSGWIVQPLEDDQRRMWVSTSRGIFWVSRSELDDVADGRRTRLSVNLYDSGDDIQMSGAAYGHPAGYKDGKGRLVFATSGGVVVVDPMSSNAPRPAAVIEELRLDGKRVAGALPATSAPRNLDVSFAARSFEPPDTIRFRYRLLGRDLDWIESGGSRTAHFAQLPAGDYRLLIEARTRESDWSAQPAVLAFSLRPPFHRSPLFLVACLLAAGGLLFAVHRLRLARARAVMQAALQERSRLARDLHDTLAQAFVATSVQLECLGQALEAQKPEDVRRHLDSAREVVSDTIEEARRAVWVLRPQTLDGGLAAALSTMVNRLSASVSAHFDVIGRERALSPLVASTLLRIAQEAVANAHRHGHAEHITVQLSYLPEMLALSVSDDGQGLSVAAPAGDSTGIAGMKGRAADIGGTLVIDSAPGRGTTVRLEVPA